MKPREFSGKIALAASKYEKEKEYWLNRLSGEPVKANFPFDITPTGINTIDKQEKLLKKEKANISGELFSQLIKLSSNSNYALHMILVAAVTTLLNKYTHNDDILVGMPIYKQEIAGDYLNTLLVLRNQVKDNMNFKGLLLQVKQTIVEADENQNYPIEKLMLLRGFQSMEMPPFHLYPSVGLL